jgi:hypothetical protein
MSDKYKHYEVEMCGLPSQGAIRIVDVPLEVVQFCEDDEKELLDRIFMYGQNDMQAKQERSVSAGDVIRLDDRRFQVYGVGFREILPGEKPIPMMKAVTAIEGPT